MTNSEKPDTDKPTADSAVELDETVLDTAQGGTSIKHASTVMHKKAPAISGGAGIIRDGVAFVAPGDVAG
jgi:hypothetical protein